MVLINSSLWKLGIYVALHFSAFGSGHPSWCADMPLSWWCLLGSGCPAQSCRCGTISERACSGSPSSMWSFVSVKHNLLSGKVIISYLHCFSGLSDKVDLTWSACNGGTPGKVGKSWWDVLDWTPCPRPVQMLLLLDPYVPKWFLITLLSCSQHEHSVCNVLFWLTHWYSRIQQMLIICE